MAVTGERKRQLNREAYLRRKAGRERQAALIPTPAETTALKAPPPPADPAAALADWAESRLVVPAGRLRGRPFAVPEWQRAFLADALAPATRRAWLTCARKNGKTGLIAAWLLGHLADDGPLRRPAWRALVVSLTGLLAGELRRQVEEIAEASRVQGVSVRRSPAPGRLVSSWGTVDILAADKASGHAAGADLAIIDEAGLLPERRRPLWDAIRTSTSGRDGRIVGISVLGDGPMFAAALKAEGEPGVVVHRYEAPRDCRLDDPSAWAAANPGLASGIKSREYMAGAARDALTDPANAAGFRSLDLNQPVAPAVELLADLAQWEACEAAPAALPPRTGRCWLGVDLGGSLSLTAAVAAWETGRLECWVAIPAEPDPLIRGRRDGVGDAYVRAIEAGWLTVSGRKVTDARAFLAAVLADLPASVVIGCDRYRKAELLEVLDALDVESAVRWRGSGASATADGSADVRAFQRAVATADVRCAPNPMMRLALGMAAVRRDASGNPALDKSGRDARIDLASAAVIACGLRAAAREPVDRPAFVIAG